MNYIHMNKVDIYNGEPVPNMLSALEFEFSYPEHRACIQNRQFYTSSTLILHRLSYSP